MPPLIAGRFDTAEAELLGRGGMGEVWRALDRHTGRPVAIKALHRHLVREERPDVLARFLGEADALHKLDHPNIVKLVTNARDDDGRHYLIMEYVSGGSLRQLLETRGPLPVRDVVRMSLQLCDALARVHFLDIVHRDVKPDNVLLTADGTPRLTDFGIAHLTDRSQITERGNVIGTLPYLSPEACNGEVLDLRTDIWSLGVMLHEMLAGHRPYGGQTPASVIAAITAGNRRSLRARRPDVPDGLVALIDRMLVGNRAARLASMRQAGADLESLLAELAARETSPGQVAAGGQSRASESEALLSTLRPDEVAESADESPVASVPSQERADLLILLDKVRRFWITGLLDKIVSDDEYIELERRSCPSLVQRPWEHLDGEHDSRPTAGDSNTTLQAFCDADRSLLILGEPGSGKTITLLRLARELIGEAERDPTCPIPVVLNLSSWAETRGSLAEWIALELTAKYQIPRQMGRDWLRDKRLLLLLDELDGAQREDKGACIVAINEFREEYGLVGLVVCGRQAEYQASSVRLVLGGAFTIAPLNQHQVAASLESVDNAFLTTLLEKDAALNELAQSPLMLTIIKQVYEEPEDGDALPDAVADAAGRERSLEQRREELFDAYVARMNRRASAGKPAAAAGDEALQSRLNWLARKMLAHNQATFLIEQMQPSWLPSRFWQWLYLIWTRLIIGTLIGLTWGVQSIVAGYPSDLHLVAQAHLSLSPFTASVLMMTALGGVIGLCAATAEGLLFESRRKRSDEALLDVHRGYRDSVLLFLSLFVGAMSVHLAFGTLASGMFDCLALTTFTILTLAHHESSQSHRTDLRVIEAFAWSWRRAWWWLLAIGLWLSLAGGTLVAVLVDVRHGVYLTGASFVFFFIYGGLRGCGLETRDAPNQGIRLSAGNSPRAGLILGGAIGLYYWPTFGLQAALAEFFALGILGALFYGLADVIKHACLRLLLAASGRVPLDLVSFLDAASSRAILRRVGGGYIFMHRRMIDYFAAQSPRSKEPDRG